jgi:cell wall-associated NlpC family hydrolase
MVSVKIKKPHPYALFLCLALLGSPCLAAEPALAMTETLANAPATSETSEETGSNWSARVSEVLVNALSLTGVRYKYGGNSPETGFDCSGFVRYVFKQATSLSLPHSAMAISQLGKSVSKDELQPGDLVFFNTLRSTFSHVGIYLGNNRFIHSPSRGGKVRVESMDDVYWAKNFNGAQRIDQAKLSTAE